MVEAALERFGRLDVLVNNAALIPWAPIDEIDLTEWRRITAVNLDGVFLACKAVLAPMRAAGYGRIVNISSTVILTGVPNVAHYSAAKGGVLALTRGWPTEVGADGITVNAVAPGLTRTEGTLETRTPTSTTWSSDCRRSRVSASPRTSPPRSSSSPPRSRAG